MGCVACDLCGEWVSRRGGRDERGGERGNIYLVAETLGGDDGDFIADTLVGFEVEGELWVVALDDYFGGFFDGLLILLLASLLHPARIKRARESRKGAS
jgi:hypothetical protein